MPFPTLEKLPEFQSMLVIHQGALGDFILALPALETLRKTFPKAKTTIIGYPRILELVNQRFYAEEIYSIDQKGMATFFVQGGSLNFPLSQFFKPFDLIVVFGKEGALIRNLKQVCQGQVLHINPFPPWDEKIHLTDHLLRQFSGYGFPVSEMNPRLYLKESDQDWAKHFWRQKGLATEERSKGIVLHPGSGSKKKVWPLERFLALAQAFQNHLDSKILIVLGPVEGPEVEKTFTGMKPRPAFFVKGLSLLQLASVMEGSRLFIGNDSGITHLAAALGLPTVAIFGPTDPEAWSPRGKKIWVVRKEFPCSPCSQERFIQCKGMECLKAIELGDVLRGLEKIGIGLKS